MRVLYFGTYDRNFGRNRILIDGLRANGTEVVECHRPLWKGTDDKLAKATGRWGGAGFLVHLIRTYVRLVRLYWPLRHSYDVMMLGYTGQFDALVARPLATLAGRPLVLDLCMSLYLILLQRGLAQTHTTIGKGVKALEWLACRLPHRLVIDTLEYRQYFCDTYGLDTGRFRLVPAGADTQIFRPLPPREHDGQFRVGFAGTFIPGGHGIEVILHAANLLRGYPDIHFELIGDGQARSDAMTLAESLTLPNVVFTGWVLKAELPARLAYADVLLGVFGTSYHVKWTVPNKIFEGLAMARPVISADSPAMRRTFEHGKHVYLVEPNNPAELAEAILTLQADRSLRDRLALEGLAKVRSEHSLAPLGACLLGHLEELAREYGRGATR